MIFDKEVYAILGMLGINILVIIATSIDYFFGHKIRRTFIRVRKRIAIQIAYNFYPDIYKEYLGRLSNEGH